MENINLELYKIFCCVCKHKNITTASKEMLISQPAITQSIKKLEDEIGYKLFYRKARGVELTEVGEQLYNEIVDSINCLNTCKSKLDNLKDETKVIRIGGGNTLLKHNAVEGFIKFRKLYPSIKIEIHKGVSRDLLYKVEKGELDLALINMPIESNENLIVIPIEKISDAFVASTDQFKKLENKRIDVEELSNLPMVLQSPLSSSRKYLNEFCKKNNILLNECYELESYDLVLAFIKAGLGIGFVNKNHVKKELESHELFEINLQTKFKERTIGVAINKKSENNKYLTEFINLIKQK